MATAACRGSDMVLTLGPIIRHMKTLHPDEYLRLVEEARVATPDRKPGKVFRCADGYYIKLFRQKRGFSSTIYSPYMQRFCRAARRLAELGIPTVRVVDAFRVKGMRQHAVKYVGLEGRPLRAHLNDPRTTPAERDRLLTGHARFLARLHEKGVYFRAIHLNNVIALPDGSFGLIDLADCHFFDHALSEWQRARNFKPPMRYDVDRIALESFGLSRFITVYMDAARLPERSRVRFLADLAPLHPSLGEAATMLLRDELPVKAV